MLTELLTSEASWLNLEPSVLNQLKEEFVPRLNKYIPHSPTDKQIAFLLLDRLDAFYGGAVGGGKSDALLMAALQYVDVPDYNAIIIRDTFKNLNMPGSLIPRAVEWLLPTDAKIRDEGKQWIFPSGATLNFGYLDGPRDHFNYQSSEFQFVGIDEAVNIREDQALYMFSRLRKLVGSDVPLRFRCASNPPKREQLDRGGWVKERYVDKYSRVEGAIFIPAGMDDNPYLDKDSYMLALNQLDPVTRAQLVNGDWNINVKGRIFDRSWFKIIDIIPRDDIVSTVRYWDLAATEQNERNKKPCFTAGIKMSKTKHGQYIIENCVRFQKEPLQTEQTIQQTGYMDGKRIPIYAEQEGGSGGKITISHYKRNVLSEFVFKGNIVAGKGSKLDRARPLSSQAEAGNVMLLNGYWVKDFLEEAETFPDGTFKDQIDAASGAYEKVSKPFSGIRVRSV